MENDAAKYHQDELRPRFSSLANRHENGTAPRAVTAFQLFQTPPELAQRLAKELNLRPGFRVLEPSAGLGRLLDVVKPFNCECVAVETCADLCRELYHQERQAVKILQRDFLACSPDEIGSFDAAIMNPPFHMRSDIRHILHARRFLKPSGILAALCLDTHHRESALRSIASKWEKIPAGAFKSEGTRVACILLTIQNP